MTAPQIAMTNNHYLGTMSKEDTVKQLAMVFAKAVKGLEDGIYDNAVMIPFSSTERIEVITTTPDGVKYTTIVNAPF